MRPYSGLHVRFYYSDSPYYAYMRIDIITVLPEMIEPFVSTSIVGRAQREGFAEVHTVSYTHLTLPTN